MELKDILKGRRSVRAYKANTTVDKETVLDIIATAQQAPSWKNSQTGRYYVVMDKKKLAEVKESCLPEFNRKNCENAPVLIITTFEKGHSGFDNEGNPVNELGDQWGAYDIGLQNQLLILAAKEYGLDTLIMGIRDEKSMREQLNIPETQQVVSVISLGYRNIEPTMPKRKEINEIVKIF